MNILVVRLSAIGDCCLVLPVIRAILEQNTQAKVQWLIGKPAYELLQYSGHPRLEFKVVDKPKRVIDYLGIRKQFLHEKYDYLLAMQASTRANLIYPLIKAKYKIGFDKERAREFQWLFTNQKITFKHEHLHESFCQFANELGIETENLDWNIVIPKDRKIFEKNQIKNKYVVLNPAASKLERSWSSDRYASIIDWLYSEYQLETILTGASMSFELALARDIEKEAKTKVKNLVGKTSLLELGGILESAELVVAPDTGPAHIANGLGKKVVGIYAVAPSWLSAPYNFQDLVIDQYEKAVRKILRKKAEDIKWGLRVHNRAAMDLIEVEMVKNKIRQAFGS